MQCPRGVGRRGKRSVTRRKRGRNGAAGRTEGGWKVNVATLILNLQERAQPDDEVTLIVEESHRGGGTLAGVFTGKVIGTGTGAETGKCEIYGIA